MHLLTHALVALLIARKLNLNPVAALFALVPDVDFLLPTHRKFTHSLLCFVLCFPLTLLFGCFHEYCLGFLSHLVLDMMTPLGVPILWPYPYHFVLFDGKATKKVEVAIVAILLLWNFI